MSLRSALQAVRQRPRWRTLLVAVAALVLVVAVGSALVLDHPAAHAGLGATDWSAFSTITDEDRPHAVAVERVGPAGARTGDGTRAGTRGVRSRYVQFANGSYVERVVFTASSPSLRQSDTVGRSVVQVAGERYERESFAADHDPETLRPHVYADGEGRVLRTAEYREHSVGSNLARWVETVLSRQAYARAGTERRNGTEFARYDVLGHRDAFERLTDRDGLTGYVLVDGDGRLRYARLGVESEPVARIEYRAVPGRTPTVPGWVDTARGKLTAPPDRPNVSAYRHGDGVLLVGSGQWTPAAGVTVAVVGQDDTVHRTRRAGGVALFERHGRGGNGTHLAWLTPAGDDRLAVSTGPPAETTRSGTDTFAPERVVVDRNGRNLVDAPVQPASRLGSVYSVTAAHLRPRNGGGRVLRVDDLRFGDAVGPNASVTITVANGTAKRSVTVPARTLSSDRFYLLRTTEGLEVRNAGGIAVHVTPSTRFATKRFVANATLTVTADGLPIVERRVPERVTQASTTPLSELLTGVGIETHDEPPDTALQGQGRELRAMNWTGYTLVDIHSWDYDELHVSGGYDIFHPDVLGEDETGYYRASDGARYRVETGNGTVLHEGVANGSRAVSP